MFTTTCILDRRGPVDDVAGPWHDLIGDLDPLVTDGVDAIVPAGQREEFRRQLSVALTDGRAGMEHPVDRGDGRRWLAWSLSLRGDGRLDAVVIDVTSSHAASAWTAARTIAPRLVAAAPDQAQALRTMASSLGHQLGGTATVVVDGPGPTSVGARALSSGRAHVAWPGEGEHRTDCIVALPVPTPDGRTAVVTVATPHRLDLWVDGINLAGVVTELADALARSADGERQVEAASRERRFVEDLGRELHRPLDLMERTLREAGSASTDEQRAYLVERATTLAARLSRVTSIVTTAARDGARSERTSFRLADAVAEAISEADRAPARVDARIERDWMVVADRELLVRALTVLLQLTSGLDHLRLLGDAGDGNVGLRVDMATPTPGETDALTRVGVRLVAELVAASGGEADARLDGAPLLLVLPTGDARRRPT